MASETAWPDSTPSGWSPDGLARLESALKGNGCSTAFMIVEGGRPVLSLGQVALKSSVVSVRKSLISILFGIQVARATVRLADTLETLGIDDVQGLAKAERQATVGDLLMARSGVYHPAVYDTSRGRPARGTHAPGSRWFYNNWDFNALGAILSKCSGQTVANAFATHLAGPLGMEDFAPGDIFDQHGPESLYPVYKMRLSARDLARIGLLALRRGRWGNRQIVSAMWMQESTQPHTDLEGGRGYGLLWWTVQPNGWGDALSCDWPHFYASGHGGQYLIIIPALDLVIVHRCAKVDRGIHHGEMGHILRLTLAARKGATPPPSSPAAPVAS